jgi:hypothetical protein
MCEQVRSARRAGKRVRRGEARRSGVGAAAAAASATITTIAAEPNPQIQPRVPPHTPRTRTPARPFPPNTGRRRTCHLDHGRGALRQRQRLRPHRGAVHRCGPLHSPVRAGAADADGELRGAGRGRAVGRAGPHRAHGGVRVRDRQQTLRGRRGGGGIPGGAAVRRREDPCVLRGGEVALLGLRVHVPRGVRSRVLLRGICRMLGRVMVCAGCRGKGLGVVLMRVLLLGAPVFSMAILSVVRRICLIWIHRVHLICRSRSICCGESC